jgi:hypothetical protein
MAWRSPSQRGVTPQNRGRFNGYDVLDEVERWDDVTAGVVLARLALTTDLSFFTMEETAIANVLCDLLLAQDCEPRVPVIALIDERLATGETDGWHYEQMPEDGDAWRRSLAHLDEDAQECFAGSFATRDTQAQAAIIQAVQTAADKGDDWHGLPASAVWSLWTRYVTTAFYSHPWAWNEIGFGGPAYPRGYKNLGVDAHERWEGREDPDDPHSFAARVEQARRDHALLRVEPEPGSA